MFVYVDDTLQLALDCVAMVTPQRGVAFGWAMTPRDVPTGLSISAGGVGDCPIGHCSFHPRPDVVPADPARTSVNGFTLVFDTPDDPPELVLSLVAGEALLRADLRDPQIEGNLPKATADRNWRITFGLLRETTGNPALAELLSHGGRAFGAFADWMARLPLVRGKAENFGQLAEVEALAAASGEVVVMMRAAGALPRGPEPAAALVGWLRGEDGAPHEPLLLPLADWHAARLPAALAGYGRLEPGLLDRLAMVEVILHAELRPGEEAWLRCQPRAAAVPELLDAAARGTARNLAAPVEGTSATALDLLRRIIARREAAFAPTLAALAGTSLPAELQPPGTARLPRIALILGADDPTAARLFHVTAAEFERRCDTVLVMGAAAEEVAHVFARRGRVAVMAGVEAAQAMREAAGRAGILAVEAAAFAQAVASGTPELAFSRPLDPAEVARLLTLHAVAGCAPSLTDSLQRLLRARRAAPEPRFAPIPRVWGDRHAAELVNAHLQRLWSAGVTGGAATGLVVAGPRAAAPEPLLHG